MQNTQNATFVQNVNNTANMLAILTSTNATVNAVNVVKNVVSTNANATAINAQINAIDSQIANLVAISALANAKNKKLIDKALKNLLAQSDALTAQL